MCPSQRAVPTCIADKFLLSCGYKGFTSTECFSSCGKMRFAEVWFGFTGFGDVLTDKGLVREIIGAVVEE
jgi:hypothetical protein